MSVVWDFSSSPYPSTPNTAYLFTSILFLMDIPFSQGYSQFIILVLGFKLLRIRTEKADICLHCKRRGIPQGITTISGL